MATPSLITEPITGFPEGLPGECLRQAEFIEIIRKNFELFGFGPIETPAVERNETLESKGEINKQIYSLYRPNVPDEVDKDTGLSLHFDLTVPLARYVAQHYGKLTFPFRRYQIQKVWRGERAQKGRYREFYQCDIDVVGDGSLDLLADAEIPMVINRVFEDLAIGEFTVRMSNRKILQGFLEHFDIAGERAEETLRAVDRLPKLKGGWDELAQWLSEELSLSSDVLAALKAILEIRGAASEGMVPLRSIEIRNATFQSGIEELAQVVGYLQSLRMPEERVEVDLSITRGLDYYTGTVYETFLKGYEKVLGSVCSGGRYENLASHFTNRQLPGVGISIGLSRLFGQLIENGIVDAERETPAQVLVTVPDRSRLADSLSIASLLRDAGLNVELFVQDSKHDKQIKTGLKKKIPFAVIPWPDKIDQLDSVEVRNLITGDREVVARLEAASVVGSRLRI
jgi:histidyl-tRNA synthetase